MKKRWIFEISAISCLGLLTATLWAISPSEKHQIDNFKVSTLKGLPGVAVAVKIARDDPNTLRLLKEQDLQGEIELALQAAGVEVLRPTPEVGLYVVIINVAMAGKENPACAIHIQSSLLQIVNLARDPSIKTEAKTWPAVSQARFGVVPLGMAKRMITQTIKDQANVFSEDFKAANPKN